MKVLVDFWDRNGHFGLKRPFSSQNTSRNWYFLFNMVWLKIGLSRIFNFESVILTLTWKDESESEKKSESSVSEEKPKPNVEIQKPPREVSQQPPTASNTSSDSSKQNDNLLAVR